jgi:uncharacterized membrane protein
MKDFFKKYKYTILLPFIILVLITIVLILLSGGPQKGAFVYQVF